MTLHANPRGRTAAGLTAVACIIGGQWAASAIGTAWTGVPDTPTTPTVSQGEGETVVDSPPSPRASRAARSRPASLPGRERATTLDVTAYCWTGSKTASGLWPHVGMAAGPWPFGTRLHVEGVGVVTVQDRYGSGTSLDIFLATCEQARQFGRQRLAVAVVR